MKQETKMLTCGCIKCGYCCVKYETILLLKDEVDEKKFLVEKGAYLSEGFSHMVLKMKRVYVPFLGKIKKICYYFDETTNLCTIHSNKPFVCQQYFCSRTKE